MKILSAVAAVSLLFLTGCTGSDPAAPEASAAPEAAAPEAAAPADSRLGLPGSACDLPVAFEVAERWGAKAIDLDTISDINLAAMFRTGQFETVCSTTGEPAGTEGFLRVYLSKVGTESPRDSLETFVAYNAEGALKTSDYELRESEYSEVEIGGVRAAEVTWDRYNNKSAETSRFTAFALDTPRGTVVVELVPFKLDDHAKLLPVYELAKKTLTVRS